MRLSLSKPTTGIIFVLCFFAAVRVFIYSAAFPFFNNVDEEAHFDMALKYSKGHVPREFEFMSRETVEYIANYKSPEFFWQPDDFPEKKLPAPPWESRKEKAKERISESLAYWALISNHESTGAPLYYAVAGLWLKIGSLVGMDSCGLLYWIRFLNVLLIVILVWTSFLITRIIFPDQGFMIVGVPLLIAVLPQDTFYSIQSDVLSPVCFGIAFLYMLKFIRAEIPSLRDGVGAGLALAATALVKTSNLPLLIVLMVTLLFKSYRLWRSRHLKTTGRAILLFLACTWIPVGAWFVWNVCVHGDFTASTTKMQVLGWSYKSLSGRLNNSMFTAQGFYQFWSELIASFWRGEFSWARVRMSMPAADVFYWASSFLFLVLAMIPFKGQDEVQKQIHRFTSWSFISLLLFIVLLSVSIDFGDGVYPSRHQPYFTSGRLLSAGMIPFAILYLKGFELAFAWIKNERWRFALLILIAVLITVSEIFVNKVTFSSHYNFFWCVD